MSPEMKWAWSNVLYEYRIWSEWYFRESKCVFGTEPEDAHEHNCKQLWTAMVMSHRSRENDNGRLPPREHTERKSNHRKAA